MQLKDESMLLESKWRHHMRKEPEWRGYQDGDREELDPEANPMSEDEDDDFYRSQVSGQTFATCRNLRICSSTALKDAASMREKLKQGRMNGHRLGSGVCKAVRSPQKRSRHPATDKRACADQQGVA